MKATKFVLVALMGLTGMVRAESVSIVQITDMRGQSEFEIETHDQYTNLVKQVKDEVTVFPSAVAECKKEWEANKDNKLPFQGNRVKPRSVKKVGADFTDRAKAEKKLEQLGKRSDKPKDDKKSKSAKPKEEEVKKEEERAKAFDTAFEMITTKMGEKLKRPVENSGLSFAPKKDGEKKEEPKKEEPKKDEKKAVK